MPIQRIQRVFTNFKQAYDYVSNPFLIEGFDITLNEDQTGRTSVHAVAIPQSEEEEEDNEEYKKTIEAINAYNNRELW